MYEFQVQSEGTLKADVGVAREVLRADLEALREKVNAAKEAVHAAAVALAQIPRIKEVSDEHPTSTNATSSNATSS